MFTDMAEMEESELCSDETDGPVLFLCSSCRLPLADSGDFVGRVEGDNIILFKAVTENVDIDKSKAVSSYELDTFSTVQVLYCNGCAATIGALYIATPRHLDYKRDLFNFNTSAIICYCFGSSRKQRTRMNEKSVNLPNISYMELQLKKCRTVFGYCERAVTELENQLFQSSGSP